MAKINLNQRLKDPKGNFYGEKISCLVLNTDKELTKKTDGNYLVLEIDRDDFKKKLKEVVEESLLFENPKTPLTGKVKNERYKLWSKVSKSEGDIELIAEDIATIKECIGDVQPIIIAGQCDEMLEGVVLDAGDDEGVKEDSVDASQNGVAAPSETVG